MTEFDFSVAEQRLLRLQQFLEQDPHNQFLRMDIFSLALTAGQYALAQEQIDYGLGLDSDHTDWRYRQALLASAKGDFFGAEAVLTLLIAEGNNTPQLLYQLAYAYFCQGHGDRAMAPLQHLVKYALSEQPQALPLLMRCLQQTGHLNKALELFRGELERGDRHALSAEAWGLASLLAIDAESLIEVDAWATQALTLQPYQREGLIAKGSLALARQDVATAKKALEQGVLRYPDSGRCWSALGLTHLLVQELPAATSALETATRLMPSHIGTWHGLGWCRIVQNQMREAYFAFEQALALDHNFSESHGGIAVVLALSQQGALAQEHIVKALKLDKSCLSAMFARSILNGEGRDASSFRRMAERILGQRKTSTGESMSSMVFGKWDQLR